jgi:glutamine amidotransferase
MKKICIIDYGLGNIRSLYNSLKKIGFFPEFYSEKTNENFDLIFIPGVGSFNRASVLLNSPNLKSFLNQAKKNSVIFGICLGMQTLLSKGFEGGENDGLDYIDGYVNKMDKKMILPNVGYQKTFFLDQKYFSFLNKFNNEKFYFIHSYMANVKNKKNILASTKSQDLNYCAGVCAERIIGTQFHPEKSGEIGLQLLYEVIKNV